MLKRLPDNQFASNSSAWAEVWSSGKLPQTEQSSQVTKESAKRGSLAEIQGSLGPEMGQATALPRWGEDRFSSSDPGQVNSSSWWAGKKGALGSGSCP